jgi:hydrogenase nickel incorporation protein HypB
MRMTMDMIMITRILMTTITTVMMSRMCTVRAARLFLWKPQSWEKTTKSRPATAAGSKGAVDIAVIEGDQMTSNDADRIRDAGARAVQINTGAGCHLEADMIASAVKSLDPQTGSILMIENVGNLVCPAMFDLGEKMKIAVISTTEGEDKPIKYPHMFRAVEWVVINKMDLAPHVDFDEEMCRRNILEVNPGVKIFCLSARTGDGMDAWCSNLAELKA